MTTSHGRVESPENTYGPANAEIGWRIANPVMCALIGLIASSWSGALLGLGVGIALVAAPHFAPPLLVNARRVVAWAAASAASTARRAFQRSLPKLIRRTKGR